MDYRLKTNREKQTICIRIQTAKPEVIRIALFDPEKPGGLYADNTLQVNREDTYFIRLPQTPMNAILRIYNVKAGNSRQDNSFKVIIKKMPLKQKLSSFNYLDPDIISFVNFAQWFAENVGILSTGKSVYWSDDGKFRIHLLDVLYADGRPVKSPARIGEMTGRIEIAKQGFLNYTIPGRMAFLLHEYNHFYGNKNKEDEVEADLRALSIYLGLGYSRYEARKSFLEMFHKSATPLNYNRNNKIKEFIDNFENSNAVNYNYYYVGENGELCR